MIRYAVAVSASAAVIVGAYMFTFDLLGSVVEAMFSHRHLIPDRAFTEILACFGIVVWAGWWVLWGLRLPEKWYRSVTKLTIASTLFAVAIWATYGGFRGLHNLWITLQPRHIAHPGGWKIASFTVAALEVVIIWLLIIGITGGIRKRKAARQQHGPHPDTDSA